MIYFNTSAVSTYTRFEATWFVVLFWILPLLSVVIYDSCYKYYCCRAPNTCLSRKNTSFVATKYACRDKRFVNKLTSMLLLRQKTCFVATKVCLSRQNFCRDKVMFVATNIWRDRTFVATKIILVAVSANDSPWPDAIQARALVSMVAVHQRQQHTRAVAVV